jgi:hypothetical protein
MQRALVSEWFILRFRHSGHSIKDTSRKGNYTIVSSASRNV